MSMHQEAREWIEPHRASRYQHILDNRAYTQAIIPTIIDRSGEGEASSINCRATLSIFVLLLFFV